ncbi:YndM family protein [Fictibacillus terranigra]|uniref:YndM family protein n=1 Tax=Fictibacillus terranigra TaxID=3058424 RepID=A0ABT8E933_9BACL|nr:YndM family protein [Fictibacillus sp. CENA-BCM004]MDN4074374.1 YndM family protein [Fictibacillus sp. CENA-BCM004]
MRHLRALLIKFIASFAILYIVLGFVDDVSFRDIFTISLVLTVVAYALGDLTILPRTNNTVATVSDFVLAFAVIWSMSETMTYQENTFFNSFIASLGIAIVEYFYHKYVSREVLKNSSDAPNRMQFQTEASEEISPHTRPENRDKE